jgi:S1-C subfamily serine protease
MARSIMDQLLKYGSVKRGLLGVNIYSLTPDVAKSLGLANTQGVLVSQITEGSAAEKAGIKAGDVITSINGQAIKSNSELRNSIGLSRVGDKLDVALIRERKSLHVIAVINDVPQPAAAPVKNAPPVAHDASAVHPSLEGATLLDAPDGGVLLRSVEPRSAAELSKMRSGDRIVSANGRTIANLKELKEAAKHGGTLVLTIQRGASLILVPLRSP